MNRPCRIDGCDKAARPQRTLCQAHRQRIRVSGDPHFTQWGTADPFDVELIVTEKRPARSLTRLERVLVAQGLTARGESAKEIARIVGVTPRTVERWRAEKLAA